MTRRSPKDLLRAKFKPICKDTDDLPPVTAGRRPSCLGADPSLLR